MFGRFFPLPTFVSVILPKQIVSVKSKVECRDAILLIRILVQSLKSDYYALLHRELSI